MPLNQRRRLIESVAILVFVSLFTTGCKQNGYTDKDDAVQLKAFVYDQATKYDAGSVRDHRQLVRNLDSFFATRHNPSNHVRYEYYGTKSRYLFEMGEYDSTSIFLDTTIAIFENNGLQEKYLFDYINALTSKGRVLYATNRFDQAYIYYFKAKQLTEQIGDTCAFHGFAYGLAMIAYKQKNYQEAVIHFKSAYKSATNCSILNAYQVQEDLDNVALCYEKLNMPDSAIYFYDSVLSFIRSNTTQFGGPILTDKALAVVYGNLGGVYLAKGETDTAISLLKRSFVINIKPHYDNRDALLTHIKLADAYLKKNDLPLLYSTLTSIRTELDTIIHPLEAETRWSLLMYNYFEKTGDQAGAFRYYKTYNSLKDSLWILEKKQLQNDLGRDIKDKEKSLEIGLLLKQRELSNLYLGITVGFAIFTLAIITLIYFNYRRSKKMVQKLGLLNTRIKEQKGQLEITTGELRRSNHDKDRILHVVAHDLRNPVSAIMMVVDMLRQEETDPAKTEPLDMVLEASQGALILISELLEFSGDLQSEDSGKKEKTDLDELLKRSVELLRFKASDKRQTLRFTESPEPLYIFAHKEKIKRVVGNIIANAIKFSPSQTAIHVSLVKKGDHALIEVSDNGIGIPEKLLPHIFEPFTSAKRFGTAGEKSYGLGLSIVKQIVEANKGRIWVESIPDKGSTFFIELPLVK